MKLYIPNKKLDVLFISVFSPALFAQHIFPIHFWDSLTIDEACDRLNPYILSILAKGAINADIILSGHMILFQSTSFVETE